jgi:hypothetical protein
LVAAGVIGVLSLRAADAGASVESLKRSFENMTQGPLDLLLTPVVAGQTAYQNLKGEGATTGEMIRIGPVAYGGLLIMDWAAGFFRTLSGFAELPFGLGALAASPFTDWQPPAFFDADKPPALVDHPTSVYHIKFGVAHVGGRE